jgi:hypothetical protein
MRSSREAGRAEVAGRRRDDDHVVDLPWFPDFVAAELARRPTRGAAQADPVAQCFRALTKGDTHALEAVWPGEVSSTIRVPAGSAVTGRCAGSSGSTKPGWPIGTPGPTSWRRPAPAGAPSSS